MNDPMPPVRPRERLQSFRDWAATFVFWPAFIAILIVFDIAQRLALIIGAKPHQKVVRNLNQALVGLLRCTGVRIQVSGVVPPPDRRPKVIVSNHQSLFDIPILHTVLKDLEPRWIAKKELSRWIPSISINLRRGGNLVIDRSNRLSATRALRAFGREMREYGRTVVIFPEGTRGKDGKKKAFRPAGLSALIEECGEPLVIPLSIDGAWRVARSSLWPLHPRTTIDVIIGKPIEGEDPENLPAKTEEIITTTLANRAKGESNQSHCGC